ncbi:FecR family protein [Nitrospira moscoviensis]|nr:FecR family protein [Nitrospira moscoviensis]
MTQAPHSGSEPSAQLVQEASDWFARLRAETATPRDQAAFARWQAQSAEHRRAYESICALWETLEGPSQALFKRMQGDLPTTRRLSRPRAVGFGRSLRLAAAVAGLVIGAALWLPGALEFWRSDYATAAGERRQVALEDGSTVLLNTDSAVAIPPWQTNRRVTLLKGEASFSVASDPTKPFIVTAQAGTIRVVGTAFTVRHRSDRVTVTVSEGTVTVGADATAESVRVEAGQEVSYGADGIGPVMTADLLKTLAWQRGQLVFTLDPLEAVIEELNRYHHGVVVVADPALRTRIVSGVFTLDDPAQAIRAITRTLHIRSVSWGDRLIVLY